MAKIIYTHTDEAPLLATYSFLPILEAYASTAGVEVETRDISLSGRILAQFSDILPDRAGRAGQDPRSQYHQAAQHLGVRAPAQGRHR